MKTIFFLTISIFLLQVTYAQTDSAAAIAHIKKLAQAYESAPYLGFDVKYRYSSEANPSVYLDSLDGKFKIKDKKLAYTICSTQVVYDGSMAVVFYHEDSIIYLSKPQQGVFENPLAIMDSVNTLEGYKISMSQSGKKIIISMKPTDTSNIKEIVYEINKKTGFLNELKQVVNRKMMYEEGVAHEPGYAIVEIKFSNYSKQPFDTTIFDTSKYVQLVQGKYHAAYPYESYTIFNGNINL